MYHNIYIYMYIYIYTYVYHNIYIYIICDIYIYRCIHIRCIQYTSIHHVPLNFTLKPLSVFFFGFGRVLRRTALAVKLHIPPFQLAVSMCAILGIFFWLVVTCNHLEKYLLVNGKDYPMYYGKIKTVPNHQPVMGMNNCIIPY